MGASGYFSRPGQGPAGVRAGSAGVTRLTGINRNYDPKAPLSPRQERAMDRAHVYGGPKSGQPIGVPQVRQAAINGVAGHHSDVPAKGGGHGGNPNHDEHGRFT